MLALTHAVPSPSARQTASALRLYLSRLNGWPARSPADASPPALAADDARLGADAGCSSFIAVDFHRLLLAGLPAHCHRNSPSKLRQSPTWVPKHNQLFCDT